MANFFSDNEDMLFRFKQLELDRIIDIREGDFLESKRYDYAPETADDAIDSYRRVLEMAGELCAERIAPNAEEIDLVGNTHENWQVTYHPKVQEAIDLFTHAELTATSLPRKYGGLNLPSPISTMIVEMLSRADPGIMTILGLQDIAETIYLFGNDEQCNTYLPKFADGATGAMVLTEPDAGSDLQAVMLKAEPDLHEEGLWRLNGVKRFITNGCGNILLVLARSEPGTTDGRGLSLFVCERGEGVKIRRIEHKLGINSSPTCEIQFENTPCYLVGRRRRGLTQYVMALMNGARLGIAAQAVGLAEAAYVDARNYAESREQFGKKIKDMPAVYDMLLDMRTSIEAARALLYDTTHYVEISKMLNKKMEREGLSDSELKREVRKNTLVADLLTPIVKYYATEMVNDVCYKAIQILGGSGFMKDYPVERYYRDARIMNIYEGTSQLQVIAAFPRIAKGIPDDLFAAFAGKEFSGLLADIADKVNARVPMLKKCVESLKEINSRELTSYYSRAVVDVFTDLYLMTLLLKDGAVDKRKSIVARLFASKAMPRIDRNVETVLNRDSTAVEHYMDVIGPATE